MFEKLGIKGPSERHQPDPNFILGDHNDYTVQQRFYTNGVGVVAMALPLAIVVSWAMGNCLLHSISHHYYTPFFGDLLVGSLVFIGTFMIAYQADNQWEKWFSKAAGICAIFVGIFPTSRNACHEFGTAHPARLLAKITHYDPEDISNFKPPVITPLKSSDFYELFPLSSTIHVISAAILFAFLAYFSFFIFTRTKEDTQETKDGLIRNKRIRNCIYKTTGWIIVCSMALMGLAWMTPLFPTWDEHNGTLIVEAIALEAFGIAWLTKGRVFGWLLKDSTSPERLEKPAQ